MKYNSRNIKDGSLFLTDGDIFIQKVLHYNYLRILIAFLFIFGQ